MSNTQVGAPGALLDRAIARVERAGKRGLHASRLAGLAEEAELESEPLLDALRRSGRVVERGDRWSAVRFSGFVVGRIRQLSRGDALLLTGERGEAGYLIPARALADAREGDTVLARPDRRGGGSRRGRGRAASDLPRARVEEVIDRRWQSVVGTIVRDGEARRLRLVPFDRKLELDIEVRKPDRGSAPEEGDYVVVELEAGSARPGSARGRVVEHLGSRGDAGADVAVVLRHYEIPEHFAPDVLAASEVLPENPPPSDWAGREDLRERVIVTIDGESARDFDDAICVERSAGGGFLLGVHIADVSHYVRDGSALDLSAYDRGTSVYFPDRAVPMLPERLSNGLCSLRPDVPRLTMSAWLEIGRDGEVLSRRFSESVIRSHRRLTYDEVRRLLEEPRPEDREEYGEVLELLAHAHELMQAFFAARRRSGSIDFDLPEGDVVLDAEGRPIDVRPGERTVANRIIEECMIAANRAVAAELFGHEVPALYRVHESPRSERLEDLAASLANLGLKLDGELENLHPSALQAVLEQVEGKDEEPFVSTLVLRSMRQALYDPQPLGHYALAARHYAHFTSPIRRYPDLLVHRQLKRLLHGGDDEGMPLADRLSAIAEHCSATERRAERAGRTLVHWKLVRLLADRVGDRFAAHVTGVQSFGLFVQLDEFFVDGLVPIRSFTDDYYVLDPVRHQLVGQEHGAKHGLAEAVEVVLTEADETTRMLTFALADGHQTDDPGTDRVPGGPSRGERKGGRSAEGDRNRPARGRSSSSRRSKNRRQR